MKLKMIPTGWLVQGYNARVKHKKNDVSTMMASLQDRGFINPLKVIEESKNRYRIVAGNTRFLAAKKLGLGELPCTLMEKNTEKWDEILTHLHENKVRDNLTYYEEGTGYKMLLDEGLNINEIAVRMQMRKSKVQSALRAVDLIPEDLRDKVVNLSNAGNKKRVKGEIPSSLAEQVFNSERRWGINTKETRLALRRKLLDYAAVDTNNGTTLAKILKAIESGASFNKAVSNQEKLHAIKIEIVVFKKDVEKWGGQKELGKAIRELVYTTPEMGIEHPF